MPLSVTGKSSFSYDNYNKNDTLSFDQKPHSTIIYIEGNNEEKNDMKIQLRFRKLLEPSQPKEPATILYVDIKFYDSSKFKENAHVDINDKCLDKVQFVLVNSLTGVGKQLTIKLYVDITMDEITLARNYRSSDFDKKQFYDLSLIFVHFDPNIYNHGVGKNMLKTLFMNQL